MNFKSYFVLCHQTKNRFSKLLSNSDEDKCVQSHLELFFNKIMFLLYDIYNNNINIAIILKTIELKIIIKLWHPKIIGHTKFILVLMAELSCEILCDTFLRDLSVLSTY